MEKVISIKELMFEKMYKDFYKDINNRNFTLNCFFKADTVKKVKIG